MKLTKEQKQEIREEHAMLIEHLKKVKRENIFFLKSFCPTMVKCMKKRWSISPKEILRDFETQCVGQRVGEYETPSHLIEDMENGC